AQVDLWIDQEEGFIVKMELTAEGQGLNEDQPDAEGQIELRLEYSDFNEEFEIEAPEVSESSALPEIPTSPGDLGELLGFEVELPEEATVEVFGNFGEVVVPLSMEETTTLVTDLMTGAGLTLNEEESFPDAGVFYFDRAEGGRISVFLTAREEGGTEILFEAVEE
ncbi:MAG: hypothetical protein ACRDIB_16675, partial [Ardenticatenaceae bacterium]